MLFSTESGPGTLTERVERSERRNPYITLSELTKLCQGNETLQECLDDLVTASLQYAESVMRLGRIAAAGSTSIDDGLRYEAEDLRGRAHDASISSVNILGRQLKLAGCNTNWLKEVAQQGRPGYTRFLLLIAFETEREENHG
ncbi:MAG: hypothetical protein M1459_02445 [Patescibacteria group bacterium]|nr:hypothetical protein [Patescibacteria group bacterium]